MKGYLAILPADLTKPVEKVELNTAPNYPDLQKAVGGYIEAVPHFDSYVGPKEKFPAVMFCNEEGKIKNLPHNLRANTMWAACLNDKNIGMFDSLMGDVVMLWGDPEFMAAI